MPNSLIPLRLQFFAIIISGVLLIGVVSLIRKGKLKEGYSILWFVIGFGFLLIALWTDLLKLISSLVGVDYEPATLFAILLIIQVFPFWGMLMAFATGILIAMRIWIWQFGLRLILNVNIRRFAMRWRPCW